ncbi:FAD/NAD(P)-binding protein [Iodidimonas nitroreducens]|nr:FAD/NAD(P)-binding protein [Iodidimonas nitroreducens]
MKDGRNPRYAIIGGGLTGIATAIACLKHIENPAELWLFEPSGCVSGGIAYGEAAPYHLLNIRAHEVSVIPDQPDDFLVWCLGRLGCGHEESDLKTELSHRFLPRKLLRDYLEDRLNEARLENPHVNILYVNQSVDAIHPDAEAIILMLPMVMACLLIRLCWLRAIIARSAAIAKDCWALMIGSPKIWPQKPNQPCF